MIKNCILLFLIFFLPEYGFLFGQTVNDSIVNENTVKERETTVMQDSVETFENGQTSLVKPVPDSTFLFSDSVREVSARQVRSYVLNPDYAYANNPEYWKRQTTQKPGAVFRFLTGPVFRWTLFIAVTLVLLFGIFQLAKEGNFSWLSRRSKRKSSDTKNALAVEEMDFESEIRNFVELGDYRLAVQYMYLRLIHTARKKTGIPIRDSSTNTEIVRAFESYPHLAEFKYLVYAYEYIFYGGFFPDAVLFDVLRNKFDDFQKQLSV